MSDCLRVASIVEGDGEVEALPILLRRIWCELLGGTYINAIRPYRVHRDHFLSDATSKFADAVRVCAMKVRRHPDQSIPGLVLVRADRDPAVDPTCVLGPVLDQRMNHMHPGCDATGIFADDEFESWFVAAAPSLKQHLEFEESEWEKLREEGFRRGKRWIQKRFIRPGYKETADQPRLTAAMDLNLCRQNSPSFDKLCRELEKRL